MKFPYKIGRNLVTTTNATFNFEQPVYSIQQSPPFFVCGKLLPHTHQQGQGFDQQGSHLIVSAFHHSLHKKIRGLRQGVWTWVNFFVQLVSTILSLASLEMRFERPYVSHSGHPCSLTLVATFIVGELLNHTMN